jgi:class 3 adenylate cyclase
MVERVEELGKEGSIPPVRVGIGINSGQVIAGNVGNAIRKFYSLTGKNVIIAARVEQLNKEYGSQILISQSVHDAIGGEGRTMGAVGKVALKGIEQPVGIFRLA